MTDSAAADEWITTKQAEKLSGFTTQWVRELCDEGKVECDKFGRWWRVNRASLEAYMETERRPGPKTD